MNTSYVKQFDEQGECTNPIKKDKPLLHYLPNRQSRRSDHPRFKGNKKGVSLSIFNKFKYKRVCQFVNLENGKVKTINHYVLQ